MDCSINIGINQLFVSRYYIAAPKKAAKPKRTSRIEQQQTESETDKIRKLLEEQYTPKKRDNMHLAAAYRAAVIENGQKKAERLSQCSRWLEFAVHEESGQHKLTKTSSCHVRLCPICQWRRSLNTYRNMARIYNDKDIRKYKHMFLTLTQKNVSGGQLSSELKTLSRNFTKFMRTKEINDIAVGYMRSIEVTRNRNTGMYHPHIHAIITVPRTYGKKEYIRKKRFAELWAQVNGLEYEPVVDVRMIKHLDGKTLAEIAKYSVKPTDYLMPSEKETAKIIETLDSALDGKRFVSYGGKVKEKKKELLGVKEIEDIDGEPLEEYQEWEKIVYEWHFGEQTYKRLSLHDEIGV